ncbi:hypothetical protein N8T08_002441 [Aspergillus melleus]|uniref:Uncharacterized protein n=1 Tax=Aspergillus melleus TaxID=138277 RepID=A0ACC3AM63_9EURO|nr:hypothetical protein N8T08_002441 [Aspergillus melleus]
MSSHLLRPLFLVLSSLVLSCLALSANEPQPTGAVASPVDRVPDCAVDCTREFIQTDYATNACSQGLDIECLCRTNTNSGYTLGEAALRCSLAFCALETVLRSTVYSICDAVEGALPRTHATITATIVTTTVAHTETSSHTETPTHTGTSTTSLGTSSTISPTTSSEPSESSISHTSTTLTPFESPISITRTTQHSSTSDQPSSTSAASNESRLKPSAVIGVSVASGVSGFFVIGIIIFCCCRKARRRNQQAKDNNFFEIGGAMSEPPDFSSPPRRPTPGPSNPSSRTINEDSRPARLMSPFEYRNENPAVVVTGPDGDHNNNRNSRRISPSKIGFAFSSNSENEASPSQSSQRTISDLLPEKPAYDLYPQPLRWSQQKTPRPASGATLFEEDVVRPRGGPGAPTPFMIPSAMPARYNSSRQYNRAPMAGLPDNPRAMMHGFEGRHNGTLTPRNPDSRKKPIYAYSGAGVHPPRRADIYDAPSYHNEWDGLMHHENYVDSYWQQPDHGYMGGAGMPSPRNMARRSSPQSSSTAVNKPSGEFETININENSGSRRTSRHSGSFRPLSPLKEVRTPTNVPPKRDYFRGDAPVNEPGSSRSTAAGPAHEIVSRPRIVRQDDIKRVQVRRGKPQPAGQTVPYTPDDYWHENESDPLIPELNSHALVSDSRYPIERMGRRSTIRAVPTERNLTPSRHGTDLILRVD